MLAEIANGRAAWQLVAHQISRDRRKQSLSAMTNGHQPRGAVQRGTIIIAGARFCFAGMQADAYLDMVRVDLIPLCLVKGLLSMQRRRDAVQGSPERSMNSIPGRLDNMAVTSLNGLAQNLIVPRQGNFHRLGILLPKLGAA